MQIVSIGNVADADGLTNLTSALRNVQPPRVLVAILPEYDAHGRLDRLNVVTYLKGRLEQGDVNSGLSALLLGATMIVSNEQLRRRAAAAADKEPTVTP